MTITKKQRVDSLKSLKALANDYLDHYKVIANEKSKTWIHRKAELSIEQLTEIIKQINKDLHPDKVSAYCKPMPVGPSTTEKSLLAKVGGQFDLIREYFAEAMQQTNLNFALFEVAKHAPENNIIHDITWLSDGTIGDFIEIALGQKPITYFENYLVSKLFEVKQLLIPYFKLKQGFSERLNIIRQAIYHTQKKNYLISNILLITVTESIVRELCRFLFQKQNPIASREEIDDYVFNKFNSLDTLISKGNWQSDFPIPLFQAVGTYTDVNEETLNEWRKKIQKHKIANAKIKKSSVVLMKLLKTAGSQSEEAMKEAVDNHLKNLNKLASDLLSENDMEIKIGISTMLNFLVRKYKDDRNLIIHGNFEPFNHKWKNYINYAALMKIFEIYKKYDELYT